MKLKQCLDETYSCKHLPEKEARPQINKLIFYLKKLERQPKVNNKDQSGN